MLGTNAKLLTKSSKYNQMQNCKTSVGTTAQKSSKSSLLFHQAPILAILMLAAGLFVGCQNSPDTSVKGINYGSYEIIELDSCEYVVFRESYKGGICHKENCKYCLTRKK